MEKDLREIKVIYQRIIFIMRVEMTYLFMVLNFPMERLLNLLPD